MFFHYPFADKMQQMLEHTGDFVENQIGRTIQQTDRMAPELVGKPERKVWYMVPLKNGICADGSPYHVYIKRGNRKRLCIFFSGGGVAWDQYMAERPVTGGKVAAGQPNFYWNNLRPFTQVMNINVGITETGGPGNPFDSWSFLVITYATGDFHVGTSDYEYQTTEGTKKVVHFQGYRNFSEAMKKARELFPDPEKLLIAGDSAGGFAVPALTPEILGRYYPDCKDVTCLSDSSLLRFDRWQDAAKNVWKAPDAIWKSIRSDNIILDWYRALIEQYGRQVRYLFASSLHDYLLSTFYNVVHNNDYSTNSTVQHIYSEQLRELLSALKELTPDFGFFINNWRYPLQSIGAGGTVHTAVRKPYYHIKNDNEVTMARWLFDAVNGEVYDVGMDFFQREEESAMDYAIRVLNKELLP